MKHRHNIITVLIPAHNEEGCIAQTLQSLMLQDRKADRIIVAANGCTDSTVAVASEWVGVTVLDLPRLPGRKSQALNVAWENYADDADLVVCLDADTELPPNALGDWEKEFDADPTLGGSRAKFTMRGTGLLTRLQRAEYAQGVDNSLRRGWTSILAGAGCMFRNRALLEVANQRTTVWSHSSQVEDFELTYQIRKNGWAAHVSPAVRAYTDSMKTIKSLWSQRMKWQAGTAEDLMSMGLDKYNRFDWRQQALGLVNVFIRLLWLGLTAFTVAIGGSLSFQWYWALFPILYVAVNVRGAWRIPHRDKWDVALACMVVPYELFSSMQMAWFVWAWWKVVAAKVFRRESKDFWVAQYAAEGVNR